MNIGPFEIDDTKPFKPVIRFNRSEGFIEAIYEDCSYFVEFGEVTEIYRANDNNRIVGWRTELRMDEDFLMTFQ